MKKLILVTLFSISTFVSMDTYAQVGSLDTKFSTKGYVTNAISTSDDLAHSISIQPDGKIVQIGETPEGSSGKNIAITRYNTDGTLDNTFDGDGRLVLNYAISDIDLAYKVVVQKDGKILIGGYKILSGQDIIVARLNSDGTNDKNFNKGEHLTLSFGANEVLYDMLVDANGKILLTGFTSAGGGFAGTKPYVVRLNSDGSVDNTFGTSGVAALYVSDYNDIATWMQQSTSGKIAITGYSGNALDKDFYVAQLNSNGTIDTKFGTNGYFIKDFANDNGTRLIYQGDKIVACGTSDKNGTNDFVVYRLNTNGTIDNTFGTSGYTFIPIGTGSDQCFTILEQIDGKIVLAGFGANSSGVAQIAIARISKDGKLDASFASGGKALIPTGTGTTIVSAGAIDKSGAILLSGRTQVGSPANYDFLLAKIVSGVNVGIIDFEKISNQILISPVPFETTVNIEYTLTKNEILSFDLYDVQGKLVQNLANKLPKSEGKHKETFDVSNELSHGVYILSINNGSTKQNIKIIK